MDKNGKWVWRCIVCEKEVKIDHPGDDSRASWPNLEGGTVEIDFGYGSRFDDMNFRHPCVTHQACVCDDCYEVKKHLTRTVAKKTTSRWQILPPEYDKCDPPDAGPDEIRALLAEIVRPECVDEWLETPNELLGGQKPIDVAKTAPGDLLDIIRRLRSGEPT